MENRKVKPFDDSTSHEDPSNKIKSDFAGGEAGCVEKKTNKDWGADGKPNPSAFRGDKASDGTSSEE
jgi:hypothetical protein